MMLHEVYGRGKLHLADELVHSRVEDLKPPMKDRQMSLTRLLAIAFGVVLGFDVIGLVVSVATRREDILDALVIGTAINAPFTFVAVQALVVMAAVRLRGNAGRAAAVLLVLLSAISVISGFEDGSYAAQLAVGERAIQLGLVAATAAMGLLAAAVVVRPRPPAPRTPSEAGARQAM